MTSVVPHKIDLPPPANSALIDSEQLTETPATVHFVDGSITRGTLKYLSYAQKKLVLETEDKLTSFTFNKVAYINFSQKLKVRNSAAAESSTPTRSMPAQAFKISLTNGDIVSGRMKTAVIDKGGVHIFKLFDTDHVVRMFFLADAVAEYQLGDLLGDALVNSKKIDRKTLDQALKAQKKQRGKRLGDYLLSSGAIGPNELESSLEIQKQVNASDDRPDRKLGEILLDEGLVEKPQLDSALKTQNKNRKKKIGMYLQDMGVSDSEDIQIELARQCGLPFLHLDKEQANEDALNLVPREIAQKYQLVPLKITHGRLLVAVSDPLNKEIVDTVHFVSNLPIELVVAGAQDINATITRFYDEVMMHHDIAAAENIHQVFNLDSQQRRELKDLERMDSAAPIVRLVARFIIDAIQQKASDIHIRPKNDEVDLLVRIDGELIKIRSFNKTLLSPIISRIKIIGKMDIAERRLPQDGGAQVIERGHEVDLRISIIPTIQGESAVIRLLNSQVGLQSIADLGFSKLDAEIFADMMHKSYGLVLVTGPTGSGKSTTLYAALKEVINRNLNIITVENPVEYHIEGIEQIQVNTVPGYTFAKALRHILRHDPDVIMIGEIRDEETSKIAVESALTGHLVLSTLHTNDAAGAVTRLLEMGVDPYLLNGTLLGIFAQRLVRRICNDCIQQDSGASAMRKTLNIDESEGFYRGVGCENCHGTGYKGRIAAYELLQVSSGIQKILSAGVSTQEVHAQAVKDGMTPLTDNALALARNKITSLEEVYRVRLE